VLGSLSAVAASGYVVVASVETVADSASDAFDNCEPPFGAACAGAAGSREVDNRVNDSNDNTTGKRFMASISSGESACIIVLTYMPGNEYATGYVGDMIGIKFRYPNRENWHHVPYQPHD
jgi:hypothetical protein